MSTCMSKAARVIKRSIMSTINFGWYKSDKGDEAAKCKHCLSECLADTGCMAVSPHWAGLNKPHASCYGSVKQFTFRKATLNARCHITTVASAAASSPSPTPSLPPPHLSYSSFSLLGSAHRVCIHTIITSHAFTRDRESAYRLTETEPEVVCVRNFLIYICVRWANPSLRKSKRE